MFSGKCTNFWFARSKLIKGKVSWLQSCGSFNQTPVLAHLISNEKHSSPVHVLKNRNHMHLACILVDRSWHRFVCGQQLLLINQPWLRKAPHQDLWGALLLYRKSMYITIQELFNQRLLRVFVPLTRMQSCCYFHSNGLCDRYHVAWLFLNNQSSCDKKWRGIGSDNKCPNQRIACLDFPGNTQLYLFFSESCL